MQIKLCYPIYLLALTIPFTQSIPVADFDGRHLHIGFDTILIAIITIFFAVSRIFRRNPTFIIDEASKWILAWCCWNICTVVYTGIHAPGLHVKDSVITFLRWAQYVPIFFIVLNTKLHVNQVKTIVSICTLSLVIMALVNIFEISFIGIDYSVDRGASMIMRPLFIEEVQSNYNISAVYMMLVLLLVTPIIIRMENLSSLSKFFICFILLLGIWVTSSRISILAYFFGFTFLCVVYYRRVMIYGLLILTPISFAIVISYIYFFPESHLVNNFLRLQYLYQGIPMLFGKEFSSLGLPYHVSGSLERYSMWNDTLSYISQSPLIGHGFRATRWSKGLSEYFTADSYYLELVADTGLIGLLFFSAFLFILARSSFRLCRLVGRETFLGKFSIGYNGAFIGVMIANLVGSFFMAQRIWGVFILLSALICNQLNATSKEHNKKLPNTTIINA